MSVWRNNSFLNRVSRTFLILGIVPSLFFLVVYSCYTAYTTRKDFDRELNMEISQILRQMDVYCGNLKFISDEILYRSNFYNSAVNLKYGSDSDADLRKSFADMVSSISNYGSFQDIYNVIYLTDNGYYYNMNATPKGSTSIYRIDAEKMEDCPWIEDTQVSKSALVWTMMNEKGIIPNITEEVFSLVRAIHVPTEVGGYLITQIRMADILPAFQKILEYDGCVCILAQDGALLYAQGDLPSDADTENLADYSSRAWLKKDMASEEYGFQLAVMVPYAAAAEQILGRLAPLLLICGIVILSVILLTVQYARSFSQPLISLTNKIKGVTLENLDAQSSLELQNASDEILYLNQVFSDMSVRLNKMIEEKMTQQAMQAELKYRVLQYQINPHFIYNTLDVIGTMGYENDGETVYQACQMLAKIMRYSLMDSSAGTTFRQEFDNVRTYLTLMKLRYEHKIEFTLDLDERLDACKLPYFTAQPLAENVFSHAFDSEHPVVRLTIRSALGEDGIWHILVEDDGRPISDAEILKIDRQVSSLIKGGSVSAQNGKNLHGIGLKNTLVRLHFFLGESFGCRIHRREDGSGCVIELSGTLRED